MHPVCQEARVMNGTREKGEKKKEAGLCYYFAISGERD
jgi:hypothetical protein